MPLKEAQTNHERTTKRMVQVDFPLLAADHGWAGQNEKRRARARPGARRPRDASRSQRPEGGGGGVAKTTERHPDARRPTKTGQARAGEAAGRRREAPPTEGQRNCCMDKQSLEMFLCYQGDAGTHREGKRTNRPGAKPPPTAPAGGTAPTPRAPETADKGRAVRRQTPGAVRRRPRERPERRGRGGASARRAGRSAEGWAEGGDRAGRSARRGWPERARPRREPGRGGWGRPVTHYMSLSL